MFSATTVNYQKTDLHPLLPLYMVIFIAFCGYGMMVTIFVPMLMHDDGGFFSTTVPQSTRVIYGGILLALYPLGQFLGAPVIGALADKFGRKRVLSITLIFTTFFYIVISYSLDAHLLWLLMSACFLAGLTESNVAICQSAIADISTEEDRGRLFSYLYGIMSFGYVIGPLVGGQVAVHFKYSTPFWFVSALLVITYFWVLKSFHDPFVPDKNKEVSYFKSFTNLAAVFTDLPIRRVYLVNFLIYLGVFGFARMLQVYVVDMWDFSVDRVTLFYAYISLVAAISSLILFAQVAKFLSLKAITIWASIIGGLLTIIIVIPQAEMWIWAITLPAVLIIVLSLSSTGSYISTLVSGDRQGRVLGNNLALQVGAEAISASAGGLLAALLVPLPLIIYGAIAALGGLLLITYKAKDEKKSGGSSESA